MQTTIEKIYPSKPSAAGKMMPPKVKLSDGELYLPAKGLLEQLQEGMTGEASVRSEVNGQYTNYFIDSFTPSSNGPTPSNGSSEAPSSMLTWKDKLILAQSSAKTAVDLLSQCPNETFEQLHIKVYNHCLSVAGLDYNPFQ